MKFTKMHGNGNDYVYINCFNTENIEKISNPSDLAIAMSHRNFGIGADGIVLILPSEIADFRMRMFNADGSEGNMCGNASCCIAKYVFERGLTDKSIIALETKSGIKELNLKIVDGVVKNITVNMGEPIFTPSDIPVLYDDNISIPITNKEILADDKILSFTCLSMGNPHAVTFCNKEITTEIVSKYGKIIEKNSYFPERVNVEFVNVKDKNNLEMRVFERGSGETLACGTGTCATVVSAVLNGYCNKDEQVDVKVLGGMLSVMWNSKDNNVYLTGSGEFCYNGVWLK